MWFGKLLLLGFIFCDLTKRRFTTAKRAHHGARIMSRPDDVMKAECGEEIRLTCIAEGDPAPEIKWWYHGQEKEEATQSRAIIHNLSRDGRVKIKTEELYVVRSTLIIMDAEEIDEGIYQCRASNSPARGDKNINIYQHWTIEEVPVHKVSCGETTMTTTEIIPAEKYNRTVFTEAVERAISSFGVTSSTTTSTKSEASQTSSTTSKNIVNEEYYDSKVNSVLKPNKKPKKRPKPVLHEENVKNINEASQTAETEAHKSISQPNDQEDSDENSGTVLHMRYYAATFLPVLITLTMTS